MITYHILNDTISSIKWDTSDIRLFIKRNLGSELWDLLEISRDYEILTKIIIISCNGGVCASGELSDKVIKKTWKIAKLFDTVYMKGSIVASKVNNTKEFKAILENAIRNGYSSSDFGAVGDTSIDTYGKSLSVVLLIKNCEKYFPFFEYVFTDLETRYSHIEYYMYENDSSDLSAQLLERFMQNRKGALYSESISNNTDYGGIKKERGEYMCNLRNTLKKKHGELTTDYTLLMDCDVYFNPLCVNKLIYKLQEDSDIAMAASFCKAWDIYRDHKCVHYYDTFAFITEDGLSYEHTGNRCLMKECRWCKNQITTRGLKNRRYPEDTTDIKARSAFGGLVVIPTNIYNKVWWEPTICEHHGFCAQVRKYGNIVISRGIETFIAKPRDTLLDRSKIISLIY